MKRKLTQADFPIGSKVTLRDIVDLTKYRGQECLVISHPAVCKHWLTVRAADGREFPVRYRSKGVYTREVKRPKPAAPAADYYACAVCGDTGESVHVRGDDRPLCDVCWTRLYPKSAACSGE
jgi:hypothetical protein